MLATRTRIVFLQHPQEARKPTNSAPLACRILSNARIEPWARTVLPAWLDGAILLYPSPDATPLDPSELDGTRPVVIPDGTWSQASRMASVLKSRPMLRRVLPEGARTTWTVRQSADPERVSSAQAAALVLGLAGETEAAEALSEAVAEAGRRILAMRGMVRGIPEGNPDRE